MKYILGLLLFLSVTFGQVNDKNFKEKINGGMVVVVVSAEWEKNLMRILLKVSKDTKIAEILRVKSEDAPKVVKKLRFRNFPSLVLFTMVLKKKHGKRIWMENWI